MFPLNSIDMDKFIFDESKQSLEQFITNIKKYVSPPCITTNDTVLERKRKMEDYSVIAKKQISVIFENIVYYLNLKYFFM